MEYAFANCVGLVNVAWVIVRVFGLSIIAKIWLTGQNQLTIEPDARTIM